MYWSLFWRAVVLILVFNLLMVVSFNNTRLFIDPEYVQWKAPILWGCLAAILFLIWTFLKKSPIAFIFGKRLGQPDRFWKIANHTLIATLITISVLSIVVAKFFSFELWSNYKLIVPLLSLGLFPLIVLHSINK